MKRLILVSATTLSLAAGVFLLWPAADLTDARSGRSIMSARAGMPAFTPATGDRRHRKMPPATPKGFAERSAEIAATPPTTERESAIRELARDWAARDPAAAEKWAAAFDDPEDRERAMSHVCLEVAGGSPRDAIEIVRRNELNSGMIESIVGQWGIADFEAAADWARELPTGDLRDNALARLALVRAEKSPVEAASMVSTALAAGPAQEEAAIAVLHQWLRKDPDAARQWVDAFPDGELKERAQNEIEGMATHRAAMQAAQ